MTSREKAEMIIKQGGICFDIECFTLRTDLFVILVILLNKSGNRL